jgi:hypothetical protein
MSDSNEIVAFNRNELGGGSTAYVFGRGERNERPTYQPRNDDRDTLDHPGSYERDEMFGGG